MQQQRDVFTKQLDSLQKSISSKLDKLLAKTDSASTANLSLTPASQKILINLSDSVQHQSSSELSSISEQIMSLNSAGAVQTCTSIEEVRRSKEDDLVIILLRLADISTLATPVSPVASPRGVEMEKSRAPSFTGKTIDYPEFRRGWAKVAAVHWDDDNQVEQIKYKVDSATRRLISCCSTMFEVWK